MAGSEPVGAAPSRPHSGAGPFGGPKFLLLAAAALAVFLYFFPLFRVVSLKATAAAPTNLAAGTAPAAFDAVAAATKFWQGDLRAAHPRATELGQLVSAIRANADTAKAQYAKSAGLGSAYYFVRGTAKVIAREKNVLRLAPVGAESEIISIRLGPVFGNTVRDGCGLLDVNAFPGLQEFNALSAELNALVEKSILPLLREKAVVGATLVLVGCAEAPESAADAGEPMLTLVPVHAEIR